MSSIASHSSWLSFGRKLFFGLVVPAGLLCGFMLALEAQSRGTEIVLIDPAVVDHEVLASGSVQMPVPAFFGRALNDVLMLYGCDVAFGPISDLFFADAALVDATRSFTRKENWRLEEKAEYIEASIVADFVSGTGWRAVITSEVGTTSLCIKRSYNPASIGVIQS